MDRSIDVSACLAAVLSCRSPVNPTQPKAVGHVGEPETVAAAAAATEQREKDKLKRRSRFRQAKTLPDSSGGPDRCRSRLTPFFDPKPPHAQAFQGNEPALQRPPPHRRLVSHRRCFTPQVRASAPEQNARVPQGPMAASTATKGSCGAMGTPGQVRWRWRRFPFPTTRLSDPTRLSLADASPPTPTPTHSTDNNMSSATAASVSFATGTSSASSGSSSRGHAGRGGRHSPGSLPPPGSERQSAALSYLSAASTLGEVCACVGLSLCAFVFLFVISVCAHRSC